MFHIGKTSGLYLPTCTLSGCKTSVMGTVVDPIVGKRTKRTCSAAPGGQMNLVMFLVIVSCYSVDVVSDIVVYLFDRKTNMLCCLVVSILG